MTAPESAPDAAEALAEALRLPLIDALEPFADGEPFDEQELVDNLLLPAARAALSPALDAVKAEARAETLRWAAGGIRSQIPEMSGRDAQMYDRIARWFERQADKRGGAA